MANLFYMPFRPAFDSAGISVPGAKAWFTVAGTNTPSAPYSDASLTTRRTNPVVANGVGKFPTTYLDPSVSYRVRIYGSRARVGIDTPLEEYDPYTPGPVDIASLEPVIDTVAASAAAAASDAADASASADAAALSASQAEADAATAASAIGSAAVATTAAASAAATQTAIAAALAAAGIPPGTVAVPVASKALLAAIASPANVGAAILTQAGAEGVFVWKVGNYSAQATADTAKGLYVTSNTVANTTGIWERVLTGSINPEWFGVIEGYTGGTNAAANNAAFAAMWTALYAIANMVASQDGTNVRGIPVVQFGHGAYEISAPIEPLAQCIIRGAGSGTSGYGAGTSIWAFNTTAIRLQDSNTSGASTKDGVTHYGASGTAIEDIALRGNYAGGYAAEAEYHGIHARTIFFFRNVDVVAFHGDGIKIDADAAGAYGGNASHTRGDTARLWLNRCGLSVGRNAHHDANASNFTNVRCDYNRQAGLWEGSLLGNTYTGCSFHTNGWGGDGVTVPATNTVYGGNNYAVIYGQEAWCSTNAPTGTSASNQGWQYVQPAVAGPGTPAWTSGLSWRAGGAIIETLANSFNVYNGTYIEQDQQKCQIKANSLVIGGIGTEWCHQIESVNTYTPIIDGSGFNGGIRIRPNLVVSTIDGRTTTFGSNNQSILAATNTTGGYTDAFGLRWGANKNVRFDFGAGEFDSCLWILSPSNTLTYGRATAPNAGVHIDNGLWLGGGNNSRQVGSGVTSAPSGEHTGGDFYFDISASPYKLGYKCYTFPGTWATIYGHPYDMSNGIGYFTGQGGSVTQATSKATAVTLNKLTGQITLSNASVAANSAVTFTLNDSQISTGSMLVINHISGGTFGAYAFNARCASGSATINVRNLTGGALAEAIVLQFAVIKGAVA